MDEKGAYSVQVPVGANYEPGTVQLCAMALGLDNAELACTGFVIEPLPNGSVQGIIPLPSPQDASAATRTDQRIAISQFDLETQRFGKPDLLSGAGGGLNADVSVAYDLTGETPVPYLAWATVYAEQPVMDHLADETLLVFRAAPRTACAARSPCSWAATGLSPVPSPVTKITILVTETLRRAAKAPWHHRWQTTPIISGHH